MMVYYFRLRVTEHLFKPNALNGNSNVTIAAFGRNFETVSSRADMCFWMRLWVGFAFAMIVVIASSKYPQTCM